MCKAGVLFDADVFYVWYFLTLNIVCIIWMQQMNLQWKSFTTASFSWKSEIKTNKKNPHIR